VVSFKENAAGFFRRHTLDPHKFEPYSWRIHLFLKDENFILSAIDRMNLQDTKDSSGYCRLFQYYGLFFCIL